MHVADSLTQMTEALGQVAAGAVPGAPYMLVGQMTTADPTRSPAGTEALWAYTHVPQEIGPRRGGRLDPRQCGTATTASGWPTGCRPGSNGWRPGFGSRVLARRILGPRELEARNANLVGGSLNGGTAQLHQQLVFRPYAGGGRAETGIRGLYLASSSAHPGRRRARGARDERRACRARTCLAASLAGVGGAT